MIKINLFKKISFIQSFDLIYIQKTGTYQEDELFNYISIDCKLNNPFDYQMAFLKQDEIYHCFLTPAANLHKYSFCFPEPLIFKALIDEKLIQEKNFCVLNQYNKNLYLYFYEEAKFITFKKIQNCNEDNIKLFLEQNRIFELLKHYESKLILYHNLNDIKSHLDPEIKCLNLKVLLGNDALLKLSTYSIKYLNQECNFIKQQDIKIPFYIKIFILFIFSFCCSIIILSCENFIEYKQNKEKQTENLLLQEELVILKQEKQKLLTQIKDLNQTLFNEKNTTQEKIEILNILKNKIHPDKNNALLLSQIITWLNNKELKISSLKIENSQIILVFNDEIDFQTCLKLLDNHFKLIEQKDDEYKIILEKLNE